MRELIEKDREIIIVPADFRHANKGIITGVSPTEFVITLKYEPEGILKQNYCEFFTTTTHGTLYFTTYAKKIDGKTLTIASPAKHKFLQRRQYRRIKFIENLKMNSDNSEISIMTLDISAGGMKFDTNDNVNIEKDYNIQLPLSEIQTIDCMFSPIRIEKNTTEGYTVSGKFAFKSNIDKMTVIQYCAKRSIEIKNK